MRRATKRCEHAAKQHYISIHALLAESDVTQSIVSAHFRHFYPRSPCGERLNEDRYGQQFWRFLSTLSLRRATRGKVTGGYDQSDFYPRSPCGERRGWTLNINGPIKISIHALLAESDTKRSIPLQARLRFLSTLSLRRATRYVDR